MILERSECPKRIHTDSADVANIAPSEEPLADDLQSLPHVSTPIDTPLATEFSAKARDASIVACAAPFLNRVDPDAKDTSPQKCQKRTVKST